VRIDLTGVKIYNKIVFYLNYQFLRVKALT